MKRTILFTAIGMSLGVASLNTQAALVTGTLLTLEPAVSGCVGDLGTYPNCDYGNRIVSGSYFQMGSFGQVPLSPGADGGVKIGVSQYGGGTHGGAPNGTETTSIDDAWYFFSNTGLHYTTAPITVIDNDVNNDGGFTQSLDMSGWTVSWSSLPEINLGGVGTITCSLADCAVGSTYQLDYYTPIPSSPLHNFGGVPYTLQLVGTVSAVPVPAAVWLFGSGVLGLAGLARRKRSMAQ